MTLMVAICAAMGSPACAATGPVDNYNVISRAWRAQIDRFRREVERVRVREISGWPALCVPHSPR